MPDPRSRALVGLWFHLELAWRTGHWDALCGPEVDAFAADLVRSCPDFDRDPHALATLGTLHWLRKRGPNHRAEARRAMQLFRPIYRDHPDLVPEEVLLRFAHEAQYLALDRASVVIERYENTGDAAELSAAVESLRPAVVGIPSDHPEYAQFLAVLGAALYSLGTHAADAARLAEAVAVLRSALGASRDDTMRNAMRRALGTALAGWSDLGAPVQVAAEAVAVLRVVVESADPGSASADALLLGEALQAMDRHHGDFRALTEAKALVEAVVRRTRADHPDWYSASTTLSSILMAWSIRTGDSAVLVDAVAGLRRAAGLAPPRERAGLLGNLGAVLHTAYERNGDPAVLGEAVAVLEAALGTTPPDHPDWRMYAHGLAGALLAQTDAAGIAPAAERACAVLRDVVARCPPGDPKLAGHLSQLGIALQCDYDRTRELPTLREAVRVGRSAIAATSSTHPDQVHFLTNLGIGLYLRYDRERDPAVFAEGMRTLLQAADSAWAAPVRRAMALAMAATLANTAGEIDWALDVVERVVGLIPRISSRALPRSDRGHLISQLRGLPATAADVAVRAGKPNRAVELLELTRGVLIADTLDAHGDLRVLRSHAPALAAELDEMRTEMEVSGLLFTPAASADSPARLTEMDRRWAGLVERVRALPGLVGFQRPPSIDRLRRQGAEGAVVQVISRDDRGFALVTVDDPVSPVLVVDLPAFDHDTALAQARRLHAAIWTTADRDGLVRAKVAAQAEIVAVLAWLWDAVTSPVLNALGHHRPPEEGAWPRLWWCPVGITNFFPLHAAGRHGAHDDETVMDRVVSSYTPTLRALEHARTARTDEETDEGSVVVVAVSKSAAGSAELPGALAEAEIVRARIPSSVLLADGDASRAAVVEALTTSRVVHLACHVRGQWLDPDTTALALADAPLTVAEIAGLRLPQADLAYLSACATGFTSLFHADETTHVTAAFHLAGFRSVVGTVWPVADQVSTAVAREFYARLTTAGSVSTAAAAVALHETVRRRRDRDPLMPNKWAAHTHTGI
ncbi:CHAT domain-containing protein [Actinokineospora sp. NBRC 105648]|uniref:CHAT domain-containing protein n=1 Tax=Actinokineospora sp. NBRC 105648 TaxID=3032206 RepID=UPI0024A22666|nr:CHAT domain-containing protein [Actinokineospora sp. NBRC 105648]GLZ37131.1 CHAT domain-containing protein [Actinokineospora sp. NBRC 105648]